MVITNNAIDNTIGDTNPGITNKFTIQNLSNTSGSQSTANYSVAGTSAGDCWQQFTIGSTASWAFGPKNSDSQKLYLNTAASATVAPSSGTNVWNMSTAGVRRIPLQPMFIVGDVAFQNNVTGDGTSYLVHFPSVFTDQSSSYNAGTNLYTVPVTGTYYIGVTMFVSGVSASHTTGEILIRVNGVDTYDMIHCNFANYADPSGDASFSPSLMINASAGDTLGVAIHVSGGAKSVNVGGTDFDGFLIF
jgi:hypothetical protein